MIALIFHAREEEKERGKKYVRNFGGEKIRERKGERRTKQVSVKPKLSFYWPQMQSAKIAVADAPQSILDKGKQGSLECRLNLKYLFLFLHNARSSFSYLIK